MTTAAVRAEFVGLTRGGAISLAAGVVVLVLGQWARLSLGQELWILGNMFSAMSLWVGGVWILGVGVSVYGRRKTSLVVSPNGVEMKSGVFRRQLERIEASKIESVNTSESLLGGKRYGSLVVTGSGKARIEADAVSNFARVADSIREISSAAEPKARASQEEASASANSEERTGGLNELAALKERGLLSDEEFAAAKRKLLEGGS